jgi:cytochrome c oxidase subunit 2
VASLVLLDGVPSALDPASHPARVITDLWWAMLTGSAVVVAVVSVLLLVAVLRRRAGIRSEVPDRSPGRTRMVLIGGVIVPFVVFVVLFVVTVGALPVTSSAGASGDRVAVRISVTGRQWFWDVAYPAYGFKTANEIHIPVGQAVDIDVTSADVIHSFWVPQLNRKLDMFPGTHGVLRLKADRAGVFRGECAEFCGLEHARMGFIVVAEPPDRFAAWVAGQRRPPPAPATPEQERGQQVLLGSACVYCHTIANTNASGTIGPDLTHVASRAMIAGAVLGNSPGNLASWIIDPQHAKPGNKMPATALSGSELQDLLAYLETLR